MPRHDRWKHYEPIVNVVQFDAQGNGPYISVVRVVANCGTSEFYPECRVQVFTGDLAVGSLTVQQSARLRETLERAELDIKMRNATQQAASVAGTCAWCGRGVNAGDPVRICEGLVEHAGDCPPADKPHGHAGSDPHG